ncbi:flavoprotein, partial [Micrococcus luteus]|uniref:flavoprotein n=1 Tax=Micrococcus luteus TaxID=1270 RepID=UPI0019D2E5FF
MEIVLGVGGGIAAYKAALLLRLMTEAGHGVTVVPTANAGKSSLLNRLTHAGVLVENALFA